MSSVTMRPIETRSVARFVLASLLAVFALGFALHGGSDGSPGAPVPLVNALAEPDLAKFEAIDMADAVNRVVIDRSDSSE